MTNRKLRRSQNKTLKRLKYKFNAVHRVQCSIVQLEGADEMRQMINLWMSHKQMA